MQPITYSLVLNVATLIAASLLAWAFAQPWMLIVVIVLQTHAIQKFTEDERDRDEDDSRPMGFTADVK